MPSPSVPARFTFPRRLRLTHDRDYRAVYAGKMRKPIGPLVVHAVPNGRPYPRLGLSVGKVVGSAVARNRVKRLIREAFRLSQHQLPRLEGGGAPAEWVGSYDVVVGVRKHELLRLEDYRGLIVRAVESCHRDRLRRQA